VVVISAPLKGLGIAIVVVLEKLKGKRSLPEKRNSRKRQSRQSLFMPLIGEPEAHHKGGGRAANLIYAANR
jgi:hypothetical protein